MGSKLFVAIVVISIDGVVRFGRPAKGPAGGHKRFSRDAFPLHAGRFDGAAASTVQDFADQSRRPRVETRLCTWAAYPTALTVGVEFPEGDSSQSTSVRFGA